MAAEQKQSIVRLKCAVQNYDWGKIGRDSAVARIACDEIKNIPYAELWMGTHDKGPSHVLSADGSKTLLKDYLKGPLPYLFKVLSVAKALSIQAHPDMALAQKLFAERPNVYADPFHKPEMTLAITQFQAMCGFRQLHQIAFFLEQVPEFRALVGEAVASRVIAAKAASADVQREALIQLFAAVMKPDTAVLADQLGQLIHRLEKQASSVALRAPDAKLNDLEINELVLRLHSQYPGDVGVFAPYYLNCFELAPGEGMFLGPNEPHAYLSGDCIEAMSCSDNVVRAGLTPKLRDTDTLLSMLTYKVRIPEVWHGQAVDEHTRVFSPPVEEFCVMHSTVPPHTQGVALRALDAPSIVLVTDGTCTLRAGATEETAAPGSILLIPAKTEVRVSTANERSVLYRCSSNQKPFAASSL